jgi:hypothetical protein
MTDDTRPQFERNRDYLRQAVRDVKFADYIPDTLKIVYLGPRGEYGVQPIYRGQLSQREPNGRK